MDSPAAACKADSGLTETMHQPPKCDLDSAMLLGPLKFPTVQAHRHSQCVAMARPHGFHGKHCFQIPSIISG
jgi:hypothetical protein